MTKQITLPANTAEAISLLRRSIPKTYVDSRIHYDAAISPEVYDELVGFLHDVAKQHNAILSDDDIVALCRYCGCFITVDVRVDSRNVFIRECCE